MGKIIRNNIEYSSSSNSAGNISYDNSSSNLNSLTVQNAITELDGLVGEKLTQYSVMPTASAEYVGKVVQFIGTTDQDYTNGYFYVCVQLGTMSSITYSWININVSDIEFDTTPTSGSNNAVTSDGIKTALDTKQNIMQYTTMPTITASMLGKVVQYVGASDSNYKQGWNYVAVSDGAAEPTYSWQALMDSTPTSGSNNPVTSDGIYNIIHKTHYYTTSNIILGANSTAPGGTNSVVGGYQNTASGGSSAVFGERNSTTSQFTIVAGHYNRAASPCMAVFGMYNNSRSGDLLNIGNGSSTTRSNIVEVNFTSMNVNGDIRKNGVSLPTPYTTMPTITAGMLGQIAMYVGTTDANYTQGWFYIASSDGAAEPTYSWTEISFEQSGYAWAGTSAQWSQLSAAQKAEFDGKEILITDDVGSGQAFQTLDNRVTALEDSYCCEGSNIGIYRQGGIVTATGMMDISVTFDATTYGNKCQYIVEVPSAVKPINYTETVASAGDPRLYIPITIYNLDTNPVTLITSREGAIVTDTKIIIDWDKMTNTISENTNVRILLNATWRADGSVFKHYIDISGDEPN